MKMLFIAAISACLLICFVNAKPAASNYSSFIKISRDKFPSYIDVGTLLENQCGGVLLDKYTVLTSAHYQCRQKKVLILYTDYDGEEVVITRPVAQFIPNEDEKVPRLSRVAIIKLAEPIEEVKGFIHYARLPKRTLPRNAECVGVGFGAEINGQREIGGYPNEYLYDLHLLKLNISQLSECTCMKDNDETRYPSDKLICGKGDIRYPGTPGRALKIYGGPLYCFVDNVEVVYGVNLHYLTADRYGNSALFIQTMPYYDWIKGNLNQ